MTEDLVTDTDADLPSPPSSLCRHSMYVPRAKRAQKKGLSAKQRRNVPTETWTRKQAPRERERPSPTTPAAGGFGGSPPRQPEVLPAPVTEEQLQFGSRFLPTKEGVAPCERRLLAPRASVSCWRPARASSVGAPRERWLLATCASVGCWRPALASVVGAPRKRRLLAPRASVGCWRPARASVVGAPRERWLLAPHESCCWRPARVYIVGFGRWSARAKERSVGGRRGLVGAALPTQRFLFAIAPSALV